MFGDKPSWSETTTKSVKILERDSNQPKLHNNIQNKNHLSYEVRLANYHRIRDEIFNGPNNINRVRQKFKEKKRSYQKIVASIVSNTCDNRPFVNIKIKNETFNGLLDSGANVCVLGKNCLETCKNLNLKIHNLISYVKTADGDKQPVLGYVEVPIEFKDQINVLKLYLVPSISQTLILGIDFWENFGLNKALLGFINELTGEIDPNQHVLSAEQHQKLQNAIKKFRCFSEHGLGKTDLETHTIDTGDSEPIKQRHYPVSPPIQKLLYDELDRMLEMGVIEISESAWNSPVTLQRKPGKNRLCLDARKLNDCTKKDAYPLPHIEGLLSRLGDTHFITSVDLKDAFWQIPLDKESRSKTAFSVPGRPHYQFAVMPFGLCNAAQRMCRLMDRVIPSRIRERVFVYLDDLLIVSPDFDTHIQLVEEVAGYLAKANLTINIKKSKFCFKRIKYLGFIVGEGQLRTDPDKVNAIANLKPPRNPREVRGFIGMVGWYRRFIQDFATIAAPITDCLKKSRGKFEFTEEAKLSFQKLKDALISSPVLVNPDFTKRFFIQCDASDYGVGAVLFQKDDLGHEHPIAFYSKKLNPAQRNYTVTEKECLAVVDAVLKFRPYIELLPFTIVTDHSSLKWLMGQRELSGRLARWSLKLQIFNFEIEHRKGSQNKVPDALSRLEVDEIYPLEELINMDSDDFQNDEYEDLIRTVTENKDQLPDLRLIDGKIYKRTEFRRGNVEDEEFTWKLWVPMTMTKKLIENMHNPPSHAHGGFVKTLFRIKEYFYWPNMSVQVREFVKGCSLCKQCKPNNQVSKPPMGEEIITQRPFQKIYIDFLGPYPTSRSGNAYIFIVLDHLSKYVLLKSLRKATTKEITKFLSGEVFYKFGVPEVVHSDNGPQFRSKEFKEFLEGFGVNHMTSAAYAPQANAAERVNQSVLAAIRTYLDSDQRDWDLHLPEIECALRSAVHSSTKCSPFFALFGTNMVTHASAYKILKKLDCLNESELNMLPTSTKLEIVRAKIRRNMHEAYEKQSKSYNFRTKNIFFKPGQEIYRKNFIQSDASKNFNAKLSKKYLPCRVVRKIGNVLYEIETLGGKPLGIYHAKHLIAANNIKSKD